MKKMVLLVPLAAMLTAVPSYCSQEDDDRYHGSDAHGQDVATVVKVLDKALEVELSRIVQQMPKDISSYEDVALVDKLIKQDFKTITTKVAYAVKHDLTQEQRAIVINLLRNLKEVSAFTADDLILMAEDFLTYGRSEALQRAVEYYCPELKRMQDVSVAEKIAVFKAFEKIDLHDSSFNALKSFMCKAGYLEEDLPLMTMHGIDDAQSTPLRRCFDGVAHAIAYPCVALNDSYFTPGWQYQFRLVGDVFAIMNPLCSQLLEAIEQQ